MAVDATQTRERLLEAGLRSFAEHGVHGAQMRDIVREAGQANDSAIHYHFGSRDGLLLAICQQQIDRMEPRRLRRLAEQQPNPALTALVADLVEPTADLLRSEHGRQFLQVMAQLAGLSGVRTGLVPAPVEGTALSTQLQQIQSWCERAQAPSVARERVAFMIGALTSSLAERARTIDSGHRPALAHGVYVADLTSMLVAALGAATDPRTAPRARPTRSTRRP